MRHSPRSLTKLMWFGQVLFLLPPIVSLNACGGGGGGSTLAPEPTSYDLAAGVSGLVTKGMKANIALSGTLTIGGVATPVTGTGTVTLTAAASGTFNGVAALSQSESVSATITGGGQSVAYSTNIVDYYDPNTFALLGEVRAPETDVAQAPITYPTTVMAGSNGVLGTLSRYADKTLGVVLGTTQISYVIKAPADSKSPATVEFTDKIYDTHQALQATDVSDYSLTSTNTMLLVSAAVQVGTDSLTLTVQ